MKKAILIVALVAISSFTFAQNKTVHASSRPSPKEKGQKIDTVKAKAPVADSVKVSSAELQGILKGFYGLVDDSSDISRKASKPLLKQLEDYYNKTFPPKPAAPQTTPPATH